MSRLAALFLILSVSLAQAACPGTDLLATMAPEDRQALVDTARTKPHPEGILFRAEKSGRVLHLVGTMHLYDPRHDATLARIDPLLAQAGTVFLELGDGDEARLQAMITENPSLAFITHGPTLPDLLGDADWDRLRAAMAERGMPSFLTAKMKPWMAMANLALSRCDVENMQKGLRGLDAKIIERATALGKPPVALEPVDTALKLFAEYTQEEQLDLLRLTLMQQGEDSADLAVTVAEAYFRHEVQLIWEFTLAQSAEMGLPIETVNAQMNKIEDLLMVRRNLAWMDRILASQTNDLIAVGALHLPGEQGLLALLEDVGYTITRLSLTE